MRIIHVADLHLDSKLNNLGPKARERRAELLNNFSRLVTYAKDHSIKSILIAGDLFDGSTVSATARKAVANEIESNPEINFFYLKGNHDKDSFLSGLNDKPENLYLFNENKWTGYKLGDVVSLVGAELTPENSAGLYNSLVLSADKFNIVTLHGQESMARPGDKTVIVSIPELKNKGIDYLALGHIHEHKDAMLDARGVYVYPGCLEGRGWDEPGEKGFVVLDIDEETRKCKRSFVKFAQRIVREFDVDVSDCMSNVEITNKIRETVTSDPNDYVKINLVGPMDVERDEISLEYLTKCFEDQAYELKIKDLTTFKVNLDDYMIEQSLKGEFVRTVQAQAALSDEEKAAIIRLGFTAISGGAL